MAVGTRILYLLLTTSSIKSQPMTTLFKQLIPQFIRWHRDLDVPLDERVLNRASLLQLYREAGVSVEALTVTGVLLAPIHKGALRSAVVHIVNQEDATTDRWRSIVCIAGLLRVTEVIPVVLSKLDYSVLSPETAIQCLKTLMMLDCEQERLLESLYQAKERFSDREELDLLLVRQLIAKGSKPDLVAAYDLIQQLTKIPLKSRALTFLASIQKGGVETEHYTDVLLGSADTSRHGSFIPWIISVHKHHVFQKFLHDPTSPWCFYLLCNGISNSELRAMLLPLIVEQEYLWVSKKNIEAKVRIAFVVLLGAAGNNVEAYSQSLDDWELRCGGFLGLALQKNSVNFDAHLSTEEDEEVRLAIRVAKALQGANATAQEEDAITAELGSVGFGLPTIIRHMIAGVPDRHGFFALRFDHRIASDPYFLRDNPTFDYFPWIITQNIIKFWGKNSVHALFCDTYRDHTTHFFNTMILAAHHSYDQFGHYLSEIFLRERNILEAEWELALCTLREDVSPSAEYNAKALLHRVSSTEIDISEEQFFALFPYVLTSPGGPQSYDRLIIGASITHLANHPEMVGQMLRLRNFEDSDRRALIEICVHRRPALSNDASGARVDPLTLDDLFGPSPSTGLAQITTATNRDGSLQRIIQNYLQYFEDSVQVKSVMRAFVRMYGPASVTSDIVSSLWNIGWRYRREILTFFHEEPDLAYLPIAYGALNDRDADVSNAAVRSVQSILASNYSHKNIFHIAFNEDTTGEKKYAEYISRMPSDIRNSSAHISRNGDTFVVIPVTMENLYSLPDNTLSVRQIQDLILHLAIVFVDNQTGHLVVRVQKESSMEFLFWIGQDSRNMFFVVQNT